MDISKQGEVDSFQIAKQVDELVSNPANMERWRQKIALTFERPEVVKIKDYEAVEDYKVSDKLFQKRTCSENLWRESRDEVDVLLQKWLPDLDPKTDIDILYTLLAFYHDSRLPIRHIVDDGLKKQAPVFCEWMSLYYARGILIRPNMAIFPSQGEQCTVEQCLDVFLSHVKADLAGKKMTETEQDTTIPKKEEGNVNVNIFGDVQAGNLQIAQDASIHEQSVIKEKKKGILGTIGAIIAFILKILWPK